MNDIIEKLLEYCDDNNYLIEDLNMNILIAIVRAKNNSKILLRYDERNQEWYWD